MLQVAPLVQVEAPLMVAEVTSVAMDGIKFWSVYGAHVTEAEPVLPASVTFTVIEFGPMTADPGPEMICSSVVTEALDELTTVPDPHQIEYVVPAVRAPTVIEHCEPPLEHKDPPICWLVDDEITPGAGDDCGNPTQLTAAVPDPSNDTFTMAEFCV